MIEVKWDEVDSQLKNGVIKGYKIFYKSEAEEERFVDIDDATVSHKLLNELFANTWYNISMVAYTSVGDGVRSSYKMKKTLTQSEFRILNT